MVHEYTQNTLLYVALENNTIPDFCAYMHVARLLHMLGCWRLKASTTSANIAILACF